MKDRWMLHVLYCLKQIIKQIFSIKIVETIDETAIRG